LPAGRDAQVLDRSVLDADAVPGSALVEGRARLTG